METHSDFFVFLSFDELLRIHETIDHTIHKIIGIKANDVTDYLDDLLIIGYGIFFLWILVKGVAETKYFLRAVPYFIFATLSAGISMGFDVVGSSKPLLQNLFGEEKVLWAITWFDVVEETAKILAECFLVGMFLKGYWIASDLHSNESLEAA